MDWLQIALLCLCGVGGLLIGGAVMYVFLLYQVSKGILG